MKKFFILIVINVFTHIGYGQKVNTTERYFINVEIQCEPSQWENVKTALNDMLTLSPKELKRKKYKNYTGKSNQWDLKTLIHKHFVPDTVIFLGDNFYQEVKNQNVQSLIKKLLDKKS